MICEKVAAAMGSNEPVKLDSVYVMGSGGMSNMYFVPKGTKVYCSDDDDDFYTTTKHAVSFGWEYNPHYESNYMVHTWEFDSLDELSAEADAIFSCWKEYHYDFIK